MDKSTSKTTFTKAAPSPSSQQVRAQSAQPAKPLSHEQISRLADSVGEKNRQHKPYTSAYLLR